VQKAKASINDELKRVMFLFLFTAHSYECYNDLMCVVFVGWLRVDIVPLSVVLGALGSLCFLSILTVHSVSYPRPRRL
jgi:hypothetical protein